MLLPCDLFLPATYKRPAVRLCVTRACLKAPIFGQGKQAVVRAIDALGYLQIDTISVVDRSHHHILKNSNIKLHTGATHPTAGC